MQALETLRDQAVNFLYELSLLSNIILIPDNFHMVCPLIYSYVVHFITHDMLPTASEINLSIE
jgi:hypothetical protein